MYVKKAWQQLHKNAASNIEQVLRQHPTKQQLYGYLPPITKTKLDKRDMRDIAVDVGTNS